jgi:RNA recognition motif-containing protein
MKLMVLNLPRSMEEDKVAELFAAFGQVTSCDLVMDKVTGGSKGFGFVEMVDATEADAAIKALHGKKVGGSRLRVKISDQNK